jgi:predicted dehydrogenase
MSDIRIGILGLRHLHPRSYMPLFQDLQGIKVVAAAERDPALLDPFVRDFRIAGFGDWIRLRPQ